MNQPNDTQFKPTKKPTNKRLNRVFLQFCKKKPLKVFILKLNHFLKKVFQRKRAAKIDDKIFEKFHIKLPKCIILKKKDITFIKSKLFLT